MILMNPWFTLPTFACLIIGFGYLVTGARCCGRDEERREQHLGTSLKWFVASWVLNVLLVLGRWCEC